MDVQGLDTTALLLRFIFYSANHIPEQEFFAAEAQALTLERNSANVSVDWQFRCADARIKLKQLYPSISALLITKASPIKTAMQVIKHMNTGMNVVEAR